MDSQTTNAFVHGNFVEDIYMKPPLGLSFTNTTNVCKVQHSLYGLR